MVVKLKRSVCEVRPESTKPSSKFLPYATMLVQQLKIDIM